MPKQEGREVGRRRTQEKRCRLPGKQQASRLVHALLDASDSDNTLLCTRHRRIYFGMHYQKKFDNWFDGTLSAPGECKDFIASVMVSRDVNFTPEP